MTGFRKTDPNRTFGILRITNLKSLTHCKSLVLGCNHTKFTVYCVAETFSGEKVWRIDSFQAFGERKFGKLIDQPICHQL